MPSNYTQISRENEKKYGTDVGRLGGLLLGDLYVERAHSVFELVQNAEDGLAVEIWRAVQRRQEGMASLPLPSSPRTLRGSQGEGSKWTGWTGWTGTRGR